LTTRLSFWVLEACDAVLDPLAGPLTFDQDQQIVRIADEAVALVSFLA
jgi:hypothetical protein